MAISIAENRGTISSETHRSSIWKRAFALVSLARQRRALSDLDEHLLQDIGVTRHDAQSEAQRSFWDIPANGVK